MNCFQDVPVRVIREKINTGKTSLDTAINTTTLNKIFEAAMLRLSTCNSCYNNVS